MMTRRWLLTTAAAGAIAAAVGPAAWVLTGRTGAGDGPPAIAYGSDRCNQCGMMISEVGFASAWRDSRVTLRFDDIGCLAKGTGARLRAGEGTAFVHDSVHGDWLDAARAAFVRSPQIATPMGYGIAAFADRASAAAAYPGAPVVVWVNLLTALSREQS